LSPTLAGATSTKRSAWSATPSPLARSQAKFLHGSFGSGKSHFMAVLHEILNHNSAMTRWCSSSTS